MQTYDGKSIVTIYIQDTGLGVTLKNETQIFDPFFTTKASGMGLGLSISRRIIEEHGGNLRLTETTSKGSTFVIALPVVASNDRRSLRAIAAAGS